MEQHREFTSRPFAGSNHYGVYGGEDGHWVGLITEYEFGLFTAEYDTGGTPRGHLARIEGVFPTLEAAVRAVEEHYDVASH